MTAVVAGLEIGDPDLGVEQAEPLVHVQTFLSDTAVERLNERVAPWLTGRDVANLDLVLTGVPPLFETGVVVS